MSGKYQSAAMVLRSPVTGNSESANLIRLRIGKNVTFAFQRGCMEGMKIDDMELVREYALSGSEEAFATLVARYVDLVYSVALRLVRDVHLAEEVTQTVFIILARKACAFDTRTIIPAWLCQTTHYASAKAITTQRRRRQREQIAYMQSDQNETDSSVWNQIEPLLDKAMAKLAEKDHNALVLRFLQGRSFKEVSAALGTSEAGAKMRVNRALEKLRSYFAQRGVFVTSAGIAGAVSAGAVHAAPNGLAASSIAVAAKGVSLTPFHLSLIKSTLKIMAWTKIKTAALVAVLVLIAAGTATVAYEQFHSSDRPRTHAFAGYATPEASIESMVWAASMGDMSKILDGSTPREMADFKTRMRGQSEDQIKRGMIAWGKAMGAFKITQKEVISEGEVHLHISAPPSQEGLHDGRVVVVLRKVGDSWKQDGDLN